ncbi:unnamed protein product [Caenorhabditis angaria]|uniref:Uncharacterized protein n=1 Tax=Caenorhabditis angaria TaxID=860376 RepID=A0A9P1J242_9PELO|nr:unnamed protein product [Caenorhabditis angaria]
MTEKLCFYLYRDSGTTSDQLVRALVDQIKNFVFSSTGISLSSQGYSGIPLVGQIDLESSHDEIYKVLNVLFRLSMELEGLIFRIETQNNSKNPFYVESLKNDVVPKWATTNEDFTNNIFGFAGVLHLITPEISSKYPSESKVNIIRKEFAKTRNILVTESIWQKLDHAAMIDFGMHRTSVNLPSSLAYIAKERPDLLSHSIREFSQLDDEQVKKLESKLNENECVMVHVLLNDEDWKTVTAVADIESPADIVSYRVSLALIAFDEKHSSIPNGFDIPVTGAFQKVPDRFERERMEAVNAAMFGKPHSVSHMYQSAKALTTSKHHSECRRIFVDENSSADQQSIYSGDESGDESFNASYARKQVFKKKKRSDLGKKRELAAVLPKSSAPETPGKEYEIPIPTSSGQLKNFERAVNGDDVYRESSEMDSLGEEEDMDLFVTKTKKQLLEAMKKKQNQAKRVISPEMQQNGDQQAADSDDGFDVADLLRAAPPLAKGDDFDDI